MIAKSHDDVHKIYDSIETIKRLSDRIIGIGPLPIIGLDGILAWIPGVGEAYSVIASLIIIFLGIRAKARLSTLVLATIILIFNDGAELVGNIPFIGVAGDFVNMLFQGHLYAAKLIQGDMNKTLYIEGSASEAKRSGAHQTHVAEMRATKGKNRVVYLQA